VRPNKARPFYGAHKDEAVKAALDPHRTMRPGASPARGDECWRGNQRARATSRWLAQVLVGAPSSRGHDTGVLLDPLGLVYRSTPALTDEAFDRLTGAEMRLNVR
jgi:hypothetical protein